MKRRVDFDAMGGRRFILCVGCVLLGAVLCAVSKLAGAEFVALALGTAGVYVAGNTSQKAVEMNVTRLPAGTPIQAPVATADMPSVLESKDGPQ
jgi:hypothetical protein